MDLLFHPSPPLPNPPHSQQVKGNLVRLHLCVEELRSQPGEGCVRPRGTLLRQTILDSLQQYKQYSSHHAHVGSVGGSSSSSNSNISSSSVEVRSSTITPPSH